jgi:hypothetical protein
MGKPSNVRAEIAFGKVSEEPAARAYVEKRWPGAIVAATNQFADLDWQVLAPAEGLFDADGKQIARPFEIIAWLEVKSRRCGVDQYPSTIVAVRKHHAARYGREFFKVQSVAIVLFTDAYTTFNLGEEPDSIEDVSRRDRPGVSVKHAFFLHTRLERHPDLYQRTLELIAEAQGD